MGFWKKRKALQNIRIALDLEVVSLKKVSSWLSTPIIEINNPSYLVNEEGRETNLQESQDLVSRQESCLVELSEPSRIATELQLSELSQHLPARCGACTWTRVHSSLDQGFSLNTLYRAMTNVTSPVILLVKDTRDQVFGAVLSCPPKVCQQFYGTGESFLFTFYKEFKKFTWTEKNSFFINGNVDSLAVGCGNGTYGLWLDSDLHHGRTQHCQTFNNDLLTETEDFSITDIEVWAFH